MNSYRYSMHRDAENDSTVHVNLHSFSAHVCGTQMTRIPASTSRRFVFP